MAEPARMPVDRSEKMPEGCRPTVGSARSIDGPAYRALTWAELDRRVAAEPRLDELLSPRELEIARLVAQAMPNKSIARVLDISPWTIAAHLRRIFGKLQITSRTELAIMFIGRHDERLPGAAPRNPSRR